MRTLTTLYCLVLTAAVPLQAAGVLTLSAPLERQVHQRSGEQLAELAVSGTLEGTVDVIEAKADLAAGARSGKPRDWTVLARGGDIANGRFDGRITLEAGGWYTLKVRALRGKEVVAEAAVMKVGVGDVFLTAGQSNSANYGKPRQAAGDDRVVYFNGKAFVPARDPIPGGCGGGGSPWPILGDLIAEAEGVPVCFRSASQTWTEVGNWMPGVKYKNWQLYDNLLQCAGEFGPNGVRAVLWHQGESDSLVKTSAETYRDRLKSVIDSLNKDAGYEIPWYVAQASFHPGSKQAEEEAVARGQQLLWKQGVAHQGPVTDDLGRKYRSDGVHFNQLGLTTHARRWFEALSVEPADLDGAVGKVFDINPDGSFRFLRQNVQIDPDTGKGQAWFSAYLSKDTEFLQREERRNFSGLKDPVIAVFTGFDDANAKALKDGKLFRADQVVLRPDLKEATGVSDDGQTLTAWFTPRQGRFSRDGVIKLGDREIPGGVKTDKIRIAIAQQRSLDELKEGSWRSTLSGKLEGERFVVEKMQLNPLPDQVKDDDPKLPRVLSIGDSISMNYEQAARENLKGIANYHRITDNCWSTARCISFVSYWMGDYTKPGRGWDLILFNSGLHDMKQKELGGAYAMPLDDYKKNLRIWIEQMKPTGATLMYVTTTPVQNDSGSARYAFRTKGAEDDFNKAAREVLKDYPEILICDLAGHIDRSSEFDNWRKGRDVHFWKPEEQALVGKAVAESVKKALEVRRRKN